jgi:hypothetical protein
VPVPRHAQALIHWTPTFLFNAPRHEEHMKKPDPLETSLRKALSLHWDYTERIKDGMGAFLPNQIHKRITGLLEKIRKLPDHPTLLKRLLQDEDKRVSVGAMMWVFEDPWVSENLKKQMLRKLFVEAARPGLNALEIIAFLDMHSDDPEAVEKLLLAPEPTERKPKARTRSTQERRKKSKLRK